MKKIEAYKTDDGFVFETEYEAEVHEYELRFITEQTNSEQKVLSLVVDGLSNQEIADTLDVALVTVKKHIGNLMKKHFVTSRTYLIAKYYKSIDKA